MAEGYIIGSVPQNIDLYGFTGEVQDLDLPFVIGRLHEGNPAVGYRRVVMRLVERGPSDGPCGAVVEETQQVSHPGALDTWLTVHLHRTQYGHRQRAILHARCALVLQCWGVETASVIASLPGEESAGLEDAACDWLKTIHRSVHEAGNERRRDEGVPERPLPPEGRTAEKRVPQAVEEVARHIFGDEVELVLEEGDEDEGSAVVVPRMPEKGLDC